MMTSARIEPLQELAEQREEQAARELRAAQQLLAQRKAQLEELSRYRSDYEAGTQVAAPALLRNRLAFLDRLRDAERYQQQQVEAARRGVEQLRAKWAEQYRASATMTQLHASYQRQERQQADRREQAKLDELALRMHVKPDQLF